MGGALMFVHVFNIPQHGIKAAGRRAKACPSERAGFWGGLGAGLVGFSDLVAIKWLSPAVQAPTHGQVLARLGGLVKRCVQEDLVGVMDIALHFCALFHIHINLACQKCALFAPFPNGNANAREKQNSEYPNNKFHTFQHRVEKSEFQGAAPCYS